MSLDKLKQFKSANEKFQLFFNKSKRFSVVLFVVFVALIYAFLVGQINILINSEPSSTDQAQESTGRIKPLEIDQSAIDKIYKLEETNIEIRSLFEQARNNPFNE